MLTTTPSIISPSIQQHHQRLLLSGESSESESESNDDDDDENSLSSSSSNLSQRQNQVGGDPIPIPAPAPLSSMSPRSSLDFPDQNISPIMLSSCKGGGSNDNTNHDENDYNNNNNDNHDENDNEADSNNNNNNKKSSKFEPPKAPVNNVIKRVSFSTSPNEHIHIDLGTDTETGIVVNNDDSFTTLMTAVSTIIEEEESEEDDDDEYYHEDDDDDEYDYEDEDKFDVMAKENNNIIATATIKNTAATTNSGGTSAATATNAATTTSPSLPAPITAATATTTESPTKKERRKKIRWSGRVRVHEVRHINNIPDDEREAIWMSPIDYTMIKVMAKTTVYKIMSGEHIHEDNPDFCTRGLEFRTRSGSKIRTANKMRNRSAVLNEQDLQHEEGFYDPEFIAMASMDESFNCREEARKRAENDTISIRSYVDDVRSIVWGLR